MIDGEKWKTVEHYFQAMKCTDASERNKIKNSSTPTIAKSLGQKCKLIKNWEEIKEDVMYKALEAKFTQNLELKELLISTGDMKLIEDSPYDKYWGGRNNGKNRLGVLLMKLRDEIKE